MAKSKCTVPECGRDVYGKGLCSPHWQKQRRWGTTEGAPKQTLRQRFEAKILRRPSGCWEWSAGHFKTTGYALFTVACADGKWRPTVAHRISYELHVGPIPDGLYIDHLCRNRGCVNPDHLEAVPQRTNVLRGEAPSAICHRENRCQRGHDFTPENTYFRRRNGGLKRDCRTCARLRDAIRRQRARLERSGA